MVGVDVAIDATDLGAEHALQRDGVRVEHGDVEATLPGRGCDLGADPAGADHDDRAAAVEACAERVGVLDAAQVEHAVERFAGDRETARLGAGGQQQPVVVQPLAVVEPHLADRRVQAHGRATEAQFDVMLGVVTLIVDVDPVASDVAAQVVLGQRWPFVGALVLGPDQHEAPVEALGPQGLCRLGAGEAGANDHESLLTVHVVSSGQAQESWRARDR